MGTTHYKKYIFLTRLKRVEKSHHLKSHPIFHDHSPYVMKQNGGSHFDFPCKWQAAQKTVLWGNITWSETAKQNIQAQRCLFTLILPVIIMNSM